MRHGTANNSRRQRGRNNGGGNGGGHGGGNARRGNNQRSQVFDSNGPDVRIRGTAGQVAEKYLTLARDAASAGDRIVAESYLQHAEHYHRVMNAWNEDVQSTRPAQAEKKIDDKPAPKQQAQAEVNKMKEADLGLPSSILGADAKPKTEEKSDSRTADAIEA
jgi:hypothetical protein